MSRILLADDSPHAQRMGERILREEGHQVVSVTNGDTAMLRLKDVDPDLVIADVSMPQVSGYEICRYIKTSGNHPHARVILTVGAVEPIDEAEAQRVQADGVLKKPFEASALISMIGGAAAIPRPATRPKTQQPRSSVLVLDREQVRAAVTLALDASLSTLIDQITDKILSGLAVPTGIPTKAHAR
ncbi:MAG: response regulator [Acidobacteriota bacterium]|nr:response regulator [Acidobacteriota bacterium]